MATDVDLAPVEAPEPTRIGPVLGRTGLKVWGGYISEEFLPELRGERGYKIYDEMRRNEPTISAFLDAIELLVTSVAWNVEPIKAKDGADLAAAAHVREAMERMDRPWEEFISDICTMFPFGWALFETVYKLEDGRVWWAKQAFRGQDSLFKWEYSDAGDPYAFTQRPAPDYREITIPLKKCLLFRTRTEKNNPEGLSILRAAYKPYWYKRIIEEVEAMGAERDLLGIPVATAPFGATAEEVAELKSIVENIKNDDQAGVVLTSTGPRPEDRFELKLLTGQGSSGKVSYTDRLVNRYASEISMVALAQFIHLGTALGRSGGSYNLSSDQRDMFQVALRGWLGKIKATLNRDAIPKLLRMNGMSGRCRLTTGRISQLNLQTIGNFLQAGVQNKFLTANRQLEQFLRAEAELPLLGDGEEASSEAKPEPLPALPIGAPVAEGPEPAGIPAPKNPSPAAPENGQGIPGANQRGALPLKAAVEEDVDTWEAFTLKTLSEMAGEFWEE